MVDTSTPSIGVSHICCMGAGYVGGPTSTIISKYWPEIKVTVVDINKERIDAWNSATLPIYEPGLDELIHTQRNVNLFFSHDIDSAIQESDIIMIAVGTPPISGEAGYSADLRDIEVCAKRIAKVSRTSKIVVEKSTVPCHTADKILEILRSQGHKDVDFQVLCNPEFMSEGTAINDLLMPDRVLVGGAKGSESSQRVLSNLYARWVPSDKIITMGLWSAELTKLASNAILAQRVASINAISALCEVTGADISEVARGCQMDSRIGSAFLRPSVGFGGSCFHKDLLSLVWISESLGLEQIAEYWRQVVTANEFQIQRFVKLITDKIPTASHIACLGFAYKENTGDVRNSPAAAVCRSLLKNGMSLTVYDPKVSELQVRESLSGFSTKADSIKVCCSVHETVVDSDAVVVLTAWSEFSEINWSDVRSVMSDLAYVFDGQVMLDHDRLRALGFKVFSIGKPNSKLA